MTKQEFIDSLLTEHDYISYSAEPDTFYKRVPTSVKCKTNHKPPQYSLTVRSLTVHGNLWEAFSINIVGETTINEWANLSYYSIPLTSITKLSKLEQSLQTLWEAINDKRTTETN